MARSTAPTNRSPATGPLKRCRCCKSRGDRGSRDNRACNRPSSTRGDGGYHLVFGPDLVSTTQGTILALAEGRSGDIDTTAYAIVLRRSTDGGATWSPISTIFSVPPDSGTIVHHPSAVVDQSTGKIFVLFTIDNSLVYVVSSNDDGLTWSTPVDITSSVKVTATGNPNPAAFPE